MDTASYFLTLESSFPYRALRGFAETPTNLEKLKALWCSSLSAFQRQMRIDGSI
jgi:hypothetical protein